MFDLGMLEMLVIGALALIVVGPKDLPGLLRTCGQYVGKMRGMAREFQRSMDDAARQADVTNYKEIKDVQRDFEDISKIDYAAQAKASEASLNSSADKPASDASSAVPAATPAKSPTTESPAETEPTTIATPEPKATARTSDA